MKTKLITMTGLFIALGLLVPIVFHLVGSGQAFLPMHLPVLLAGLLLGPLPGLVVGLASPVLSSILTGMPPLVPLVPIMAGELGVYGWAAGWLRHRLRLPVLFSLLGSMAAGRLAAGGVVALAAGPLGFSQMNPAVYVKTAVIAGLPGITLQLVFLPLVLGFLQRRLGDSAAGQTGIRQGRVEDENGV